MDWQVTRVPSAGLATLAVLAGAGCASPDFDIVHVGRNDDASTIEVNVSTCDANYDTSVEEDSAEVRVALAQTASGNPDAECLDGLVVELNNPVGDRTVSINGREQVVE